MEDTHENKTEHVTPYACLARYLQEERKRRCEKLQAAAAERSREIIADFEQRQREIRAAAASEQEDLKTETRASILRPARRNAESVTLSQLGEGVDRVLDGCRKRLRAFASSPAFNEIIPLLLAEAAKPLVKGAMKGGLLLFEKGKEMAAEAGEVTEDWWAEVKAEMEEEEPAVAPPLETRPEAEG